MNRQLRQDNFLPLLKVSALHLVREGDILVVWRLDRFWLIFPLYLWRMVDIHALSKMWLPEYYAIAVMIVSNRRSLRNLRIRIVVPAIYPTA